MICDSKLEACGLTRTLATWLQVLPDVEARIAQDLFGVDMVSVVEQIRREKSKNMKSGNHEWERTGSQRSTLPEQER